MAEIFDERFDIDGGKNHILYNEHLLRYRFASRFALGKTVLDIASGTGYGSSILAESGASHVTGIDLDDGSVKRANDKFANTNLEFRVGNAEAIEAPDNNFDLVTSFETIEHLQNPEKYLAELRRVATPDALVIISTPNVVISKERNPFHVREYTRDEFEAELAPFFPYRKMISQNNGIASFIGNGAGEFEVSTESEELYFIAVCSQEEFSLPAINLASINPQALVKIRTNPALRASNFLYRILRKMGIV